MKHRALVTSAILVMVLCSVSLGSVALAQSKTYQAQKGDTLSSLAQTFLGSSSRWREIWAANPHLRNPNQIKVGTQLSIPSNTLNHHLITSPILEKYYYAALEVLNSGVYEEILSNRLLLNQKDLNQQLHITAIDSSDNITLIASSTKPVTTNHFLILRQNQSLQTSNGLIVDARILGDAETTDLTSSLLSLTVNSARQPLDRSEIIVLAHQENLNTEDVTIYAPSLNPTASIIHTFHNQASGLVVILDSEPNYALNTGAVLRYQNPGSSHSYDGVLVVISGINGAAYAAVVTSSSPPMPTASVF